jgi:uncharacterized membrane protein YjjB (DUF3815 family)
MKKLLLFLLIPSLFFSSFVIGAPVRVPGSSVVQESQDVLSNQTAKDWNKIKAGAKFASAAFVAFIAGLGFLILRQSHKSQTGSYGPILAGGLMAVPSAILCLIAIKSGIDDLRES